MPIILKTRASKNYKNESWETNECLMNGEFDLTSLKSIINYWL